MVRQRETFAESSRSGNRVCVLQPQILHAPGQGAHLTPLCGELWPGKLIEKRKPISLPAGARVSPSVLCFFLGLKQKYPSSLSNASQLFSSQQNIHGRVFHTALALPPGLLANLNIPSHCCHCHWPWPLVWPSFRKLSALLPFSPRTTSYPPPLPSH